MTAIEIATEILSGESVLGFYWLNQSWHAQIDTSHPRRKDEITIGVYSVDGGTMGEFSVVWEELAGRIVSQIQAYDDCWQILPLFPELMMLFGTSGSYRAGKHEKGTMPAAELARRMTSIGMTDCTNYTKDGAVFDRRRSAGVIPTALRIFGDEWTHYAAIDKIDDDLPQTFRGKFKALKGVA